MENTEPIAIRPASPHDRSAAHLLCRSAFPDDQHSYANNIGQHGTVNLVAIKGEQTVGFISVLINQPNALGRALWERVRPYIGIVVVSEDFRDLGVGSSLINTASRRALAATGADAIFLECEVENENAHRLYARLGFTQVTPEDVEQTFGRAQHPRSRLYRGEKRIFGGSFI